MSGAVQTILFLSVSGSALALLIFLLKPLISGRTPKAFCYYIWLLVLLRLVLPFGIGVNISNLSSVFHIESAHQATAGEIPQNVSEDIPQLPRPEAIPENNVGDINTNLNIIPDNIELPTATEASVERQTLIWSALFFVWLMGALVSLVWYIAAYLRYSRNIRRSCIVPELDDAALFGALCRENQVHLFCSAIVSTPMLLGIVRPIVVLPQFAYRTNGMETELENILLHELTHYHRHDIPYKWFVVLVKSVHWFNPVVHLISREISQACELSCDEAVIRDMAAEERQSYGNTLLELAAKKRYSASVVATTLCEEKESLKMRLLSIKDYKKKSKYMLIPMLALAILLSSCAAFILKPPESEDNSQDTYTESDWLETYHEVLSQYKDVEQRRSRNEKITIDSLGEHVNLNIIISGSNDPLVYTALYDVDGNGVPELIVGRDWSNEGDPAVEIEPLDIFTYHEGSVVNVFQGVYEGVYPTLDPVFGLSFSFSVHENGIIAVYGSSGTSMAENEFFEITPTGKALLLEGVFLFYHGDVAEPIYRHYYNLVDHNFSAPEISEDDYHSIVSKYIDQETEQHGVELIWEPLM